MALSEEDKKKIVAEAEDLLRKGVEKDSKNDSELEFIEYLWKSFNLDKAPFEKLIEDRKGMEPLVFFMVPEDLRNRLMEEENKIKKVIVSVRFWCSVDGLQAWWVTFQDRKAVVLYDGRNKFFTLMFIKDGLWVSLFSLIHGIVLRSGLSELAKERALSCGVWKS